MALFTPKLAACDYFASCALFSYCVTYITMAVRVLILRGFIDTSLELFTILVVHVVKICSGR
jgi:hypothetical protein